MSDVSKAELQENLDEICKYLKKNRNHLAQYLYKEMHRDDCLGDCGHIYAHNNTYDIVLKLKRIKEEEIK